MRTLRLGLFGLLCALALLALPLTARAAPALTLTPATTPAGVQVTIAGTGFPANAALILYVKDQTGSIIDDPTARENITVKGDGTFQTSLTPPTDAPPGRYDIIIATSTTAPELARATLTLTTLHGEALAVAPAAGPAGTKFVITGTGFQPNDNLITAAFLGTADTHAGPPTPAGPPVKITVGANGQFQATIDSAGFAPGAYFVFVARSENDPPLATETFTVTAAATPSTAPAPAPPVTATPTMTPTPAPMPGLPNTGGGGTSAAMGATWPVGVLIAALLILAVATVYRRWQRV